MISLETTYGIVTSILIITFSIMLYLLTKKLVKTYGLSIIDTKSRILELESVINLQMKNLKNLENKINEVTDEIENLSLKFYKIENILYDKKSLQMKKLRKIEKESTEKVTKEKLKLSNTEKTIINLLKDGIKTTREIKDSLNLSREHVARELKYLYDIGLVKRHTDTKPFTYELNIEKVSEIK